MKSADAFWRLARLGVLPLFVLVVAALAGGMPVAAMPTQSGTVVAWAADLAQTTVPAGLTGVTAVAGGGYHSLALKSNGTVVAWGDDSDGQTKVPAGLTGAPPRSPPVDTTALALKVTVRSWPGSADSLGQTDVPAGLTGAHCNCPRARSPQPRSEERWNRRCLGSKWVLW